MKYVSFLWIAGIFGSLLVYFLSINSPRNRHWYTKTEGTLVEFSVYGNDIGFSIKENGRKFYLNRGFYNPAILKAIALGENKHITVFTPKEFNCLSGLENAAVPVHEMRINDTLIYSILPAE